MHKKWFLRIVLLLLAAAGIGLNHMAVPNQEIVVQFGEGEVTSLEAQDAIAIVKKQLQRIGIDYIKVKESANEGFKITYYSNMDVAAVKSILSEESDPILGYRLLSSGATPSKLPFESDSKIYKLDVHEIQNNQDHGSGFDGCIVQLESKSIRSYLPDFYAEHQKYNLEKRAHIEKVAYQQHRRVVMAIGEHEHAIPEVRAGPLT